MRKVYSFVAHVIFRHGLGGALVGDSGIWDSSIMSTGTHGFNGKRSRRWKILASGF